MVGSSDKTWSTGEGNGKIVQYYCLENPMNSMKKKNDITLKDELPGCQAPNMVLEKSGEITPERMKRREPKQKQCHVVDVTGNGSKV